MQSLNKKGLSEVVQTSLIILLSISAIFTMWSYISGLTQDFENQLSPVVDCLNQNSKVQSACISTDGKVEVTINKELGETITSTQFTLNGESFSCGNSCASCSISEDKNTQTIYLTPTTNTLTGDLLIASINNCPAQQITPSQCAYRQFG